MSATHCYDSTYSGSGESSSGEGAELGCICDSRGVVCSDHSSRSPIKEIRQASIQSSPRDKFTSLDQIQRGGS